MPADIFFSNLIELLMMIFSTLATQTTLKPSNACKEPSSQVAQNTCESLSTYLEVSPKKFHRPIDEKHLSFIGPQKIPILKHFQILPNKLLSDAEVFQAFLDLLEEPREVTLEPNAKANYHPTLEIILGLKKRTLEIPWKAGIAQTWIIDKRLVDLKKELDQIPQNSKDRFEHEIKVGKKLFELLQRSRKEGGFGFQFVDILKNPSPQRTLSEIMRDFTIGGKVEASCEDFTLAFLSFAWRLGFVSVEPAYLYKNKKGYTEPHISAAFVNPSSKKIETVADFNAAPHFGNPPSKEFWESITKREFLSNFYNSKGYTDNDESAIDLALSIAPRNYLALHNKGCFLLRDKKTEAALTSFNKAIKANPLFPEIYKMRAQSYTQLGKLDLANEDIQTYTTLTGR